MSPVVKHEREPTLRYHDQIPELQNVGDIFKVYEKQRKP